ncbi:LOW QUALITY PROTEIN: hypothetical protein HID58_090514, partial [Brassica napus]
SQVFTENLFSNYGPFLHLRIFIHPSSSSLQPLWPMRSSELTTSMKKLMVTKLLGPQAQEQSRGIRADEINRFYARKKESVDVGSNESFNNIMCMMSMGRRFSEEDGEAERLKGLVTEWSGLIKRMFLAVLFTAGEIGISLFKNEIMRVSNRCDEMLERVLMGTQRGTRQGSRKDMMDVLLAAYEDKKAEYKITMNHIKAFFVELLLEPLTPLQQQYCGQWLRSSTPQHILKPPLFASRGQGTLRLHPPGPLVPREFQKRVSEGSIYPEKTRLVVNVYDIMRDPDLWKILLIYARELLQNQAKKIRKEKILKYFLLRRRGCPGSALGYIVVGTAIGVIVMEGVILTMAHPLKFTPITRYVPLP